MSDIVERCRDILDSKMYRDMSWRIKPEGRIEKVIFNNPATIVFWNDGTKTVVKAKGEPFDPEKGLAMAIAKRSLGNQGNYYNEFKKWLPEKEEVKAIPKSCYNCKHRNFSVNDYPCKTCRRWSAWEKVDD